MTESSDDATIVTLNRSREHRQAQAQPRTIPYERADFGALSAALSADIPIPAGESAALPPPASPGGGDGTAAHVSVPAGRPDAGGAPDDGASYRQTRLVIAAGLVVLLLAVWIWQRRAGVRR